jgi:hypothetical protein
MKSILAALLALGLFAGQASARTVFDDIQNSAPRSQIFTDVGNSAPRSVFDDIQDSAPRSIFDQIQESAPRSDGVFGTLENSAP